MSAGRRWTMVILATATRMRLAAAPTDEITDDVVRRVDPSVVAIQHERAAGSGFFISEDGYLLTNGHVVRGNDEEDPTQPARSITVVMYDEQKLPARVIGFSLDPDVALLKVDPPRPVRPVEFANPREAHVGQVCFAVGTPIGLKRTYTRGILSNVERADLGTETRVFQTDAAINPGNSGGPLFDRDGRVLGLNTYAGRGQNLGFTIPIDVALVLRDHFLRYGRFVRAVVPLFLTDELYDELARAMGVDRGILIHFVLPGSAAHRAGLRDGDVLIEVDGRPCSARRRVELLDFEWEQSIRQPGETVAYTVRRRTAHGVTNLTVRARLEALEPLPAMGRHAGELVETRIEALGLGVLPIVTLHRLLHSLPDDCGVLVQTVQPYSAAARAGLRRFDIVTSLGGRPTPDAATFVAVLESNLARRLPEIELEAVRGRRRLPTALAPAYPLAGRRVGWLAATTNTVFADLVRRELLADGAEIETVESGSAAAPDAMVVLADAVGGLRGRADVARQLAAVWAGGGVVAAMGPAVLVVLEGVPELRNRKLTTDPALSAEVKRLGGRYVGGAMVTDGRWITATGADRASVRAFARAVRRAIWALDSPPEEPDPADTDTPPPAGN
ncbi:MAG: trypsin-like peptidase domain-containing protein [Kiritimatiellae bacterium]|nr:trypsin-like peptidase domain-containing protein [Kiritimatiellia bacterium]